MKRDLTESLRVWIDAGGHEIGETHLARAGDHEFALCHRAEIGRTDLEEHSGAEAARELAHYDDAGKFRPLKTAPNLRHGWRLRVANVPELRRALDYFYPAMLGVWLSQMRDNLSTVPLRATLGRQTGMYRVTQKITDAQAQQLVGDFCRSDTGCLKRILWPLAPGSPILTLPAEKFSVETSPGVMPLLCQEACNLLVAKAREVVKRAEAPA